MNAARAPGRAALVTTAMPGTMRPETSTKNITAMANVAASGTTGACVTISSGTSDISAIQR